MEGLIINVKGKSNSIMKSNNKPKFNYWDYFSYTIFMYLSFPHLFNYTFYQFPMVLYPSASLIGGISTLILTILFIETFDKGEQVRRAKCNLPPYTKFKEYLPNKFSILKQILNIAVIPMILVILSAVIWFPIMNYLILDYEFNTLRNQHWYGKYKISIMAMGVLMGYGYLYLKIKNIKYRV